MYPYYIDLSWNNDSTPIEQLQQQTQMWGNSLLESTAHNLVHVVSFSVVANSRLFYI